MNGQIISVGSFSEMKNYIIRMRDRVTEMESVKEKAVSSLLNLQENIECEGIKEALDALSLAIKKQSSNVNNYFNEISRFINGQILMYESANIETQKELSSLTETQFE